MPLVTLIGEYLAKKGEEFTYIGPNNDCRNCKLKTVCFNLKPGRKYEITNVRDKTHACNVHDGKVVVIEVKELPLITAVTEPETKKNSILIKKPCRSIGCKHIEICNNTALQSGKTYKIKKTFETFQCPEGVALVKVELSE